MKCSSTHALIPEFSIPNTSLGSYEAEEYRKLRSNNTSQTKAATIFIELGFGSKYGISLERRFKIANLKSKAIFTNPEDPLNSPKDLPITTVNRSYLKRGYNPLYFSRNNILRIREIKQGSLLPLNKQATEVTVTVLNSS